MSLTLTTGNAVFVSYCESIRIEKSKHNFSVRITNYDESIVYIFITDCIADKHEEKTLTISKVISGLTDGVNTFKVQWKVDGTTVYSDVESGVNSRNLSVVLLD